MIIPRPRIGKAGPTDAMPVRRVIAFARLPSPSFDFFWDNRLSGRVPFEVVDLSTGDVPRFDPTGAFVLFCRYANARSLAWLERYRDVLSGVGLFIDDDLPAWLRSPDAPIGYSAYLIRHGILPLLWLNRRLSHLWVGSAALAAAVGEPRAQVLPPSPCSRDFVPSGNPAGPPFRIVFYSEYHDAEHDFLRPVLVEVLKRRPDVEVEVIASGRQAARWRETGVTVSPFRPWPEFRDYTRDHPAHLALVPLLPNPVNAARSPTKRIDVVRMNAAALYSQSPVFALDADANEVFLPNVATVWVKEILDLIDRPDRVISLRIAVRRVVETWSQKTQLPAGLSS